MLVAKPWPGLLVGALLLGSMLHAGFHEVCRSGRAYDLSTIRRLWVEQCLRADGPPDVVADRFAVDVLGPAAALLAYRAAQRQPDGTLTRHTLRSSVWRREAESWRLFFQQGRAAEVAW